MKRGAMLAVVALIAVAFMVCYAYTVSIGVKAEWSRAAPAGGYGDLDNDGNVVFPTDCWLLLAFYDTYGPWDVNQDGIVNDGDVDEITGAWTGEFEPYYTRADITCDGRVNVEDVYVVIQFWNQTTTPAMTEQRIAQIAIVGNIPITAEQAIERGDVNDDGVLSIEDFRLMIQYAKGEIDAFPVENGGNAPPVAVLSQSQYDATAYTPLVMDASSSYDSDGTIVSWRWMVSDGYDSGWVANMPTLTYTWEDIPFGTTKQYHVEVQVKDDYGDVSSASATVWVKGAVDPQNLPPVPVLESSYTAYNGVPITFDAGQSYDPDGTIVNYLFVIPYKGELIQQSSSSPTFTHTFSIPTNVDIRVELTVTDDDGEKVTIYRPLYMRISDAPVASFTYSPDNPVVGETVTFDASNSYDPDGIRSYYWYINGQHVNAIPPTMTHVFTVAGDYTVKLTVVDNHDQHSSTTQIIHVYDVAPPPPPEREWIWVLLAIGVTSTLGIAVYLGKKHG